MPSPITTALLFLINVIFDLYLFALMIRLILAWSKANYFNPITQVIIRLTQLPINPLRRVIPNIRNLETSTLVLIFILENIKYFIIGIIAIGLPANVIGLFLLSLADMLKLLIDTFFYAILLQAIISWMHAGYTPISQLLIQITSPIMRPFQRFVPMVGGFDLSPIPALILLQLLSILIAKPLLAAGATVAFG